MLLSIILAAALSDCPKGTISSGGYASTGMVYEYGCRTLKEAHKSDLASNKEMCLGESGESFGTVEYFEDNNPTWDGKGCHFHQIYKKRIGKKWVKITHCEFNKLAGVKETPDPCAIGKEESK